MQRSQALHLHLEQCAAIVQYERHASYGKSLSRPERHAFASVGAAAGMLQGAPPSSPQGGATVSSTSVQQRARTSLERGCVVFEHGGPPQWPPHEMGQQARPFVESVPSLTHGEAQTELLKELEIFQGKSELELETQDTHQTGAATMHCACSSSSSHSIVARIDVAAHGGRGGFISTTLDMGGEGDEAIKYMNQADSPTPPGSPSTLDWRMIHALALPNAPTAPPHDDWCVEIASGLSPATARAHPPPARD